MIQLPSKSKYFKLISMAWAEQRFLGGRSSGGGGMVAVLPSPLFGGDNNFIEMINVTCECVTFSSLSGTWTHSPFPKPGPAPGPIVMCALRRVENCYW